ncbi:MAG TPA: TetR/AcrR family transcriptional regulator [Acidimicrobiia bacterium]|nr:TetR/AcrR family transcriptional regulator [Acidimicrobiia bacterium]
MTGGRRPAHRPSRVDDVVAAGIRVFARKGLAGATMAEVAEECGMGPAALYYHFSTKEQLFAECVRSVAADVAGITGRGGAPPGSLPEVVRRVYDWYATSPDKARLFFLAAPGSTPEIAGTWAEFVEEHVRDLSRYVTGEAAPPPGRDGPVSDLAARTAIGTANAAAMAWLSGDLFDGRVGRTTVADAVSKVMLRLLPDDGEAAAS